VPGWSELVARGELPGGRLNCAPVIAGNKKADELRTHETRASLGQCVLLRGRSTPLLSRSVQFQTEQVKTGKSCQSV